MLLYIIKHTLWWDQQPTSKLVTKNGRGVAFQKYVTMRHSNLNTYRQINNCKTSSSLYNFAVLSGDIQAETFNYVFLSPANCILKHRILNNDKPNQCSTTDFSSSNMVLIWSWWVSIVFVWCNLISSTEGQFLWSNSL